MVGEDDGSVGVRECLLCDLCSHCDRAKLGSVTTFPTATPAFPALPFRLQSMHANTFLTPSIFLGNGASTKSPTLSHAFSARLSGVSFWMAVERWGRLGQVDWVGIIKRAEVRGRERGIGSLYRTLRDGGTDVGSTGRL